MRNRDKTKEQLIVELRRTEANHRQTEEALRQSEERFRNLAENTSDWLWEVDENETYTYSSPKARDILGYEPEELLGKTPFDLMAHDEAARVSLIFRRFAASRAPFSCLENMNMHKDGHVIVLETSAVPILDGRGGFRGYRGVDRDITERKRVEEELTRVRDQLEKRVEERTADLARQANLLDLTHDCVFVRDKEDRITFWNQGAMLAYGWTREEAVGKVPYELLRTRFPESFATVSATLATQGRWEGELTNTTKDGRFIVVSSRMVLSDEMGVLETDRDITERKRSEETLKESERQYRELAELLPQSVFETDANGRVTYANSRAGESVGYTQEDLHEGVNLLDLLIPEAREMAAGRMRELLKGRRQGGAEYTIRRKDGSTFPALVYGSPIEKDGAITGIRGIAVDITERKVYEEALRASEALLHAVLNQMPLGVSIREVPSLRIILVNEQAERICGATPFTGPEGFELDKARHPDGPQQKPEEGPIVRASTLGETVQGEEIECRRPDGSPVFVRVNAAPVYDDENRIIAAVSVMEDITWQKKAAEEREILLRRVEKERSRLRSVLDSLPVAVGIADTEGRLVEVNHLAAHLWHGDPPRLNALPDYGKQKAWFADTGARVEPHQWTLPRVIATSKPVIGEMIDIERFDGTRGTILQSAAPITDAEGQMTGIVSVVQDITERRQMEEKQRNLELQLRAAQKMESIGTLAGGIAHDFNNVLAAILGFSEFASDKLPSGSPAQRYLKRIFDAGIRGRELVRRILTFSRQSEPEKRPLRLGPVIAETTRFLRASLPSNVTIVLNLDGESGVVLADPAQMQQLVLNLCTNAAHAVRRTGGTISIDVADFACSGEEDAPAPAMDPGPYVRLSITDTGEGIPQEIIDRIFEPFFTTKSAGEGTGLGLSVVHGIVTSHGGAITVSSLPGGGSTFTVYLPRCLQNVAPKPEEAAGPVLGKQERVLFVDDEEALADIGSKILEDLGYQVVCRTSGKEALALFRRDPFQFDLLIADQTMPEMSGIELAKEVLATRNDMPVVLCTGFSHLVDAGAAREAGIAAFAMKPLTKNEIARIVRKALDERVRDYAL